MARVTVYGSFDSLPESCTALFHRGSERSGIFLSLPWFRTIAAGALAQSGIRIYALESDTGDETHALLPMRAEALAAGIFAARRLTAAANFYTPLFAPLVADAVRPHSSMEALARGIASDTARWDTVGVFPMDRDDSLFSAMQSAFRSAGMAVQPYRCFGNWYLRVDGRTYEQYAATLPPRLRNTLKRKAQQLAATNRLRIEIVAGGSGLEQAIEAYEAVYRASWKQPEAHPQFMPQLIRTCAREGWLRLGIAWIDGRPAAAQVWIVANGVASIYKLAYDREFIRHSVGSLLTAQLMRHVIDVDRVREVDFLSGDDAYKQDWMSDRRERWGLMAFNLRTVKGIFLAAAHLGGRAVKNVLRNLRRRSSAGALPAEFSKQ